jgi:hypothetical protein
VVEKKHLRVTALSDIEVGQELTISYTNIPEKLPSCYGFYCDCPGCPPPKVAKHVPSRLPSETSEMDEWYF